ncbi:hypothetical protein ACIA5G_41080 [Amycolatopsis sp. NPDC051758]|uniref:hypothetical protein n=1 Tax=Amycolatopsis sp. NPDC051758 TaxID=3363935 RepID=UPI0037ABED82
MIDAAGYDRFLAEARTALAAGITLDTVLTQLRRRGFSQVDSVRAVRALTGAPLAEAKDRVHVSPAWADVRERTEQFHQDLAEAAREDDGPGPPVSGSTPS